MIEKICPKGEKRKANIAVKVLLLLIIIKVLIKYQARMIVKTIRDMPSNIDIILTLSPNSKHGRRKISITLIQFGILIYSPVFVNIVITRQSHYKSILAPL